MGGGLRPYVKVTTGRDRPPRVGGDVVTFEDMREFLVAYSVHEQQMHITSQEGGDRVLARRREVVDSAAQVMVAVMSSTMASPGVDLSEKGFKNLLALICSRRVMRIFSGRYSVCFR